jgi:hypothetical protein
MAGDSGLITKNTLVAAALLGDKYGYNEGCFPSFHGFSGFL